MLLNGEEVAITKHGKIVALLVQPAKREPKRALDFKRRFSGAAKSDLPKTDIIGMLLEERRGVALIFADTSFLVSLYLPTTEALRDFLTCRGRFPNDSSLSNSNVFRFRSRC